MPTGFLSLAETFRDQFWPPGTGGLALSTARVQRVKDSLTGQYLAGKRVVEVPASRRTPSGYIEILGAAQHNLRRTLHSSHAFSLLPARIQAPRQS